MVEAKRVAKICGIRRLEDAKLAVDSGAGLLGLILVPNRKRTVDLTEARRISAFVHSLGPPSDTNIKSLHQFVEKRPKLVGVFKDQPLDVVLELQKELDLDVVQLHGSESKEYSRKFPVPVIKRFTPGSTENLLDEIRDSGAYGWALLDGESGGTGERVDWSVLRDIHATGKTIILAGGLTPDNVGEALMNPGIAAVDVSGGVESGEYKDARKVEAFVRAVANS